MRSVLPPTARLLLPLLLMLGSCSSPPQPPTVNESQKRPANSAMTVNLQACKNDLHNLNIVANESERTVASMATSLERLAAYQQALAAVQAARATASPASSAGNSVFMIRFEFGSTRVVIAGDEAQSLIESARIAPLVLLRGRTDGNTDSPAEGRIARERAGAVRDYLIAAGIDPSRIRSTYQPAGDHAAENHSSTGRGLNRRVEIELYKALPVALN